MAKRRFGTGGSGITPDYWDYAQRIRVGPARLPPEEIDAETFKEELERQGPPQTRGRRPVEELTTESFLEILRTKGAPTTYQTRSRMQRIADNLEFFQNQESYWWNNQQIEILRELDEHNYQASIAAYKMWLNQVFLPTVNKAYKMVVKIDRNKAQEFLTYAYKVIKSHEPQRKARGSMVIIERVRRMAIAGQSNELAMFTRELGPILGPEGE